MNKENSKEIMAVYAIPCSAPYVVTGKRNLKKFHKATKNVDKIIASLKLDECKFDERVTFIDGNGEIEKFGK